MRIQSFRFSVIVAAAVICAIPFLMAARTPQRAPEPARAQPDPKVIDAADYRKLLEQYRGKPLLVTFWATWCEPCRDEYPMLNELAKQYAPQGLKVIGVDLDQEGDLILMRRFIARYKPVFPNYRKKEGSEDTFVQAVLPGWNGAIPASFFYAKDGHQIGHLLGEGTRDTYEAAIRQLLSSSDDATGASR